MSDLCRLYIGKNNITNIRGWISGHIIDEKNGLYTVQTLRKKYDGVKEEDLIKFDDIEVIKADTKPLTVDFIFLLNDKEYHVEWIIDKNTGEFEYKTNCTQEMLYKVIETAHCIYGGWHNKQPDKIGINII